MPDPKIWATLRPIRVAYLFEDGLDAHAWLDAILGERAKPGASFQDLGWVEGPNREERAPLRQFWSETFVLLGFQPSVWRVPHDYIVNGMPAVNWVMER